MYPSSTSHKIINLLLEFLSKYLIWIIIVAVILIWWFLPYIMESFGQIVIFWAPVIVLIFGLLIALSRNNFKARRDREQGITQYDITVSSFDFYIIDSIIYLGAIFILGIAFIINNYRVDIIDLLQTLVYFITANWIKQIFNNKILK